MKKLFLALSIITFYCFSSVTSAATPLPATEVFQIKVKAIDPNSFFITWKIKPGYFLYADRIKLSPLPNNHADIGLLQFPPSTTKTDKLGHVYHIYRNALTLPVPILGQQAGKSLLSITFQGCSDEGFCYPPEEYKIKMHIDDHLALASVRLLQHNTNPPAITPSQHEQVALLFSTHYWPVTLLIFFGLGLLLAFTPCVLPMVPVLSGIIVGHDKISTAKAFGLSLSYVLSMAATYAFIGVGVALLGENLQVTMQSPLVITAFAGIFVLLSLSMFGLFELKLPLSWQTKLAETTRRQSSGHYINAAIMGSLSTLVLSPCVTAPLVGVLGYIAQSGNLFLGGTALFAMGLGMGAPLLLIGTSAGKWLPRTGPWMNAVKSFFGFIMLGVALFLLARILPAQLVMGLWAMLLIFAGVYAGAFIVGRTHSEKLKQSLAIIILGYGLILLIGAGMGNDNPLQPLKGLSFKNHSTPHPLAELPESPESEPIVTNLTELYTLLAASQGKPVMLDFYADWCTSCKVMEATTFQEPAIKQALEKWLVIKVDVTQNTAAQQELLKAYHVIAPPTFIFIDTKGQELTEDRLVGEISSDVLLKQLEGSFE